MGLKFLLVVKSLNLNDLKRRTCPILRYFIVYCISLRYFIHLHSLQQNCSPSNLVSSDRNLWRFAILQSSYSENEYIVDR